MAATDVAPYFHVSLKKEMQMGAQLFGNNQASGGLKVNCHSKFVPKSKQYAMILQFLKKHFHFCAFQKRGTGPLVAGRAQQRHQPNQTFVAENNDGVTHNARDTDF
jgi:hypothetical protein